MPRIPGNRQSNKSNRGERGKDVAEWQQLQVRLKCNRGVVIIVYNVVFSCAPIFTYHKNVNTEHDLTKSKR